MKTIKTKKAVRTPKQNNRGRKFEDFDSNTIQHTCGFPEPSERQAGNFCEVVDKSVELFWSKRGKSVPIVSDYFLDNLDYETEWQPSESHAVTI